MSSTYAAARPASVAARRTFPLRGVVPLRATQGRTARLSVSAVKVGEKAPDFTLPDQSGKSVKLSSFQGFLGKPVILYFYPADGTPGCTKQAKAFKDAYGEFKKLGAEVLGVSSDTVEAHVAFKKDLDLPFRLLADEDGSVRKTYKVPKDLLGFLEGRQTFVIDKTGEVKFVFNSQFEPEKHVSEVISFLTSKVAA